MAQKIIVSKRLPTKRIQNHSKLCAMHANITLTNSKSLAVSRVAGFIQNTSLLLRVKLFSFVCLFVCLFFFEGVGENVLCDNSDCYAKSSFLSSEKVARF